MLKIKNEPMFLALASIIALAIQEPPASPACTEVLLNKNKAHVISGRTLDYNCEIGSKICFRKKGMQISDPGQKFTDLKCKPFSWKAKYDAVLVDAFDEPAFVDAMNSEGLSIACLWHADSELAKETAEGREALSNVALVEYIAENAKTVDEAKKLASGLSLYLSTYKGQPMMLHWIVTDASGESIVIELKNGSPKFFSEIKDVGVMTNQPSYDRQLANLQESRKKMESDSSYNIPGDYDSKSRFVKSAFLVSCQSPFQSADEGIVKLTQILHNVESPKGSQKTGSYTQWFAVRDQRNLRYFITSVNQSSPKIVDLKDVDFAKALDKRLAIESSESGNVAQLLGVSSRSLSSLSKEAKSKTASIH